MSELDRRDFLKVFGAGTAAAGTGCYRYSDLPEKLIPYVIQPEEITPGLPVVYASTCQECPAACGLHVRTREGRPVKLEGNPEHPVNHGALCARGQAGLGRAYHPSRYKSPMRRGAGGDFSAVSWESATTELAQKLDGAGGRVAVLGGITGPTLSKLIDSWLEAVGGGTRVVYEPFAHEALRAAAQAVFGVESRPIFDLKGADLVVDFGANSLATWISPVEHAQQIMEARDPSGRDGREMRLVYVGPRQDETASSADEWLPARPGTEGVLALGLARVAFDAARSAGRAPGGDPELLARVLAPFDAASVASSTGVPAETIRRLGRAMLAAGKVVALPPGVALSSRRAMATDAAVLLLDAVVGAVGSGVQLPPAGSQPRVDDFRDVVKLIDAMKSGDVKVLLIHDSNPLYSLPADAGFVDALAKVDFVVSTASLPDETSQSAHLVLPDHSAIESWGDAEPRPGVRSVVQPTLRPLYDTQALGDTLLATARATRGGGAGLPGGSFRGVVEAAFAAEGLNWNEALAHGGAFDVQRFDAQLPVLASVERLEFTEPHFEGDGAHVLLPVPSTLLSDGRGASLPWLQETPDPVTKIAWQSWAEISMRSAKQLGVGPGDVISIETTYGTLEVPVWPRGAIRDDVVAVAIGQGHTVGRYASLSEDGTSGGARGVNVNDALPALTDESGGRAWLTARAQLRATGEHRRLPFTQGTDNKRGRLLGESISLAALAAGENPFGANERLPAAGAHGDAGDHGGANGDASGHGGTHPEGPHQMRRHYDPADDSTDEEPYRWGMTIDVDRCTGCSACVVACAVENNIPQLGEESVVRNRQMSWLRIERYVGTGFRELETGRPGPKNHEELGNTDVRNSPMLCQQCGAAPCEPVCPVIATYHTASGLNAMVYNRCIGTRYCSNNCPYKVRRFNWFDYQIEGWPEPMPLMLNPDVTVRGQGVMEKCTFCVQRIQADRLQAKTEGRALGDEIQTACQQTCPTDAIVFGNLKDPDSRASELAETNEGRAYHALHVLNTRPGITYLAKVDRRAEAPGHAASPAQAGQRVAADPPSRPGKVEAGEERA